MSPKRISYSDVVPDEIQAKVMAWSDLAEDRYWDIGDAAVELCDEWEGKLSRIRVCDALAVFAKMETSQMRDLEYVSRFTPVKVREAYDMLGRSHFRVLIPHIENLLDWDHTIMAWKKKAKTLSVRSLKAYLARENGAPGGWNVYLLRARAQCEKIQQDETTPGDARRAARTFLLETRRVVGRLSSN